MRKRILKLSQRLRLTGASMYTWLWRSSLKSCGERTRIEFPVRLEQPHGISLGDDVILYPRVWLNPVSEWGGVEQQVGEIHLHDRVKLGYGVQISAASRVTIEEDVAVAAGVVIVDHLHDHHHIEVPIFAAPISVPAPVRIGKGSFLGVHCLIGPGVQLGEHVVVAANAVVLKDVPSYCVAAGNPARWVRYHTPEEVAGPELAVAGTDRG